MRGVRGQVTLFVIIGLVALFTIGIFYLIASNRSTQDVATETSKTTIDSARATALTSAISSCFDGIVNDELRILGETGGLPAVEGYPSGIISYADGERRVLYGVTRNRNDPLGSTEILPLSYNAPRYPDVGVRIEASDKYFDAQTGQRLHFQPFQDGYFGDVNIPAICSTDGTNGVGSSLRCRHYPGNPPGTKAPSFQSGLEERIAQRIQACATPAIIEQTTGILVSRVGTPSAVVTFTPSTVLVTIKYPLEIQGGSTLDLQTVARAYKVRFMPLWQFAVAVAREESRNVTFDPSKDARHLREYREGFSVSVGKVSPREKTPSSLSPQWSDDARLVLITDQKSTVDGVAYTIGFLVESRPPMIQELTPGEFSSVSTIIQSAGGTLSGGIVRGLLVAVDPDDDPIVLSASGNRITVTDSSGNADWLTQ